MGKAHENEGVLIANDEPVRRFGGLKRISTLISWILRLKQRNVNR
tara:strand:+ start:797 stop:931 length:135 start_codon:yes stop_codon:yes gene_type:complete